MKYSTKDFRIKRLEEAFKKGEINFENLETKDEITQYIPIKREECEDRQAYIRRIVSKILVLQNNRVCKYNSSNNAVVIVNSAIASLLLDCPMFLFKDETDENTRNLEDIVYYCIGVMAGIKVYVNAYLTWDDCRVCVCDESVVESKEYPRYDCFTIDFKNIIV